MILHSPVLVLERNELTYIQLLKAPSDYLDSLPSKGIRDTAIDSLNFWFEIPIEQVTRVKKIVNLLHGASLLMDDIQDSSVLRRGQPAVHLVFGQGLAINAAGYRFLEALREVRRLENEKCLDVFCGK
jgi:Geranylgeranyl pyrophosphate synthase